MTSAPVLTNKFLLTKESWFNQQNKTGWGQCIFDKQHYHPALFNHLGITYPTSLKEAVIKRQAEYLAGRYAAKLALACCHYHPDTPLYIAADHCRSPVWPAGYLGSISHCENQAICVVAEQKVISYLGTDIEPFLSAETAKQIASQIATDTELALLQQYSFSYHIATTLLFSAKESFFKAIYPTVKKYFGFECITCLAVDSRENSLTFATHPEFARQYRLQATYQCQFQLHPQHVITLVVGEKNTSCRNSL